MSSGVAVWRIVWRNTALTASDAPASASATLAAATPPTRTVVGVVAPTPRSTTPNSTIDSP